MEQNINPLQGVYNSTHIKQGIIVRKTSNRDFIGIIVENSRGVSIRTPNDQLFGLAGNVTSLMVQFNNTYLFYSL